MRLYSGVALFLLATIVAGCEDSVNPFIEADRFYSVYGYLDTASDEQFLRVVSLRTSFAAGGDLEFDARVFTTERESGHTVEWTDSLVAFSDGSTGHVFKGAFRPIPGRTYDLTVERSDGVRTTASTTVPVRPDVQVDDATPFNPTTQQVTWSDIDFKPFRVEVWYRFVGATPSSPFLEAVVVYPDIGQRLGNLIQGNKWQVVVTLAGDKEDVTDELGMSEDARPQLLGIGMRLTMTDDQWRPPDGVFDREVLSQPGTFSNVENGFGFFGAVNQFTVEWVLNEQQAELAGYSFPN
ncbi:MAG: hypothetical protein RIE53_01605 [Rhodothermales bacterium]